LNSKKPNPVEFKPQYGSIRDELFLISFIVLCAGLVFTDAYYQRFGYRYQAFNFSTLHIIYKGLTMVFTSPFMLIPYVLTIFMVIFELFAIRKNIYTFLSFRIPILYTFIIINLLIVFSLAKNTGEKQAALDMNMETTGLPKIRLLQSVELTIKAPIDNYLLFVVDDNFVTYFEPLKNSQEAAYPIIKRVAKSQVIFLDTYF
jgi:hypothetical protein